MIVLLGGSAAGKTTIENELVKKGYKKITSYTTRPIRPGEVNGIDYHFITEADFYSYLRLDYFAEHTTYRGWHYGISRMDCKDNRVVVVEPTGFRMLKKIPNLNIISIYIQTTDRTRLIRMLKRGDDIMEAIRRLFSDQGTFNGIEQEVSAIVENEGDIEIAVNGILRLLEYSGSYLHREVV